jgi:hypothetical protein
VLVSGAVVNGALVGERRVPAANGRGEYIPCAASSARLAALMAVNAAAALAASATVFAMLNERGGTDDSAPKMTGGVSGETDVGGGGASGGRASDCRHSLNDLVPESKGVRNGDGGFD